MNLANAAMMHDTFVKTELEPIMNLTNQTKSFAGRDYSIKPNRIYLYGGVMLVRAGGAGSGCHGGNCGRPPSVSNSRRERALNSYNPATADKQRKAEANQKVLATAVRGKEIPDNKPFDVIIAKSRIAIELKTIFVSKHDRITMHPGALRRKYKAQRIMKVKAFTVVIDERGKKPRYYFKEGIGSFKLKTMTEIKSLNDLRKAFK